MALVKIQCQKCGAMWTAENDPDKTTIETHFTTFLFSTTMNPKGTYLTVAELIATGEMLLSCPKDPIPRLDDAIQRKGQGPRSQARVTGYRDPTRQS